MQDLTSIPLRDTLGRIILAAAALAALVFCWFAVRLQLGTMIADLTPPSEPAAAEKAAVASRLAPGNPVAKWLSASSLFSGEADASTDKVRLLEETVRLAPNDYHWRIELGRTYEQDGQFEKAEVELKRGVELAPSYAFAHWHLGNFYLRQGRSDEAFAELKRAAENNETYRTQVFSLAWDYFDKDPAKVEQLAAETSDGKAALALFFAARGKANESLRNWNLLTDDEKAVNPEIARSIALGLFQQRHFPEALEFSRQLGLDADAKPSTITNGGFERPIATQDDSRFGWTITRGDSKLDVSGDSSVRHEGSRSLKVSFRNYIRSDLYNIFQTVVVEPGTSYRLSFWVRTENLKTSGTPLVEIVNAVDDKVLISSKAFGTGSNDWQQYDVDFRTPPDCSGITIRTARVYCGEQCPIVGMFWYDDFVLDRQGRLQ